MAITNDGQMFWAIKNGSPGTTIIGFGPVLSDDEIWSLIQYECTFADGQGRGRMGQGKGMGPMMGPNHGMGSMEHDGYIVLVSQLCSKIQTQPRTA